MELGTKIQVKPGSMHEGQIGIVHADYGNYLFIKAEDEKYSHSFKSSGLEGKYFQVDATKVKKI